jgi:hypothetical protein
MLVQTHLQVCIVDTRRKIPHLVASLPKSGYIFMSRSHEIRLVRGIGIGLGFLITWHENITQKAVNKLCSYCFSLVVDKFGTSCWQLVNNLVDIIRLVTRLFSQVWYSRDITRMLQGWRHKVVYCHFMTVSDLLEQPCNKPDNVNMAVRSC